MDTPHAGLGVPPPMVTLSTIALTLSTTRGFARSNELLFGFSTRCYVADVPPSVWRTAIMNEPRRHRPAVRRFTHIAYAMLLAVISAVCSSVQGATTASLDQLLAGISADATWQSLSDSQRQQLEQHAARFLERDRRNWGRAGLDVKERTLMTERTAAMRENIDRVLSVTFAADLPSGFNLDRDVATTELARALVGVYLIKMTERSSLLYEHPDFRGWDGLKLVDMPVVDHIERRDLAAYATAVEARLRSLDETRLTPIEQTVRAKSLFSTRRVKHLAEPPVGPVGTFDLAAMYAWEPDRRPFTDDLTLLETFNASMFATIQDVNRGTLGSFVLNFESEFDKTVLEEYRMPPALVSSILKLGNLYRSRVFAHPDRNRPCTIYTPEQRAAMWDSFTADQISNADGRETMESYAKQFASLAPTRVPAMRGLAIEVINTSFPPGSKLLTEQQRALVVAQIVAETKPAAMLDTTYAALDRATGSSAASGVLKAAVNNQPTVGGYADGEPLRPQDQTAVDDMWRKVREYLIRAYSGFDVDLAPLIPEHAKISTTSETAYALGGEVNLGLRKASNQASLYSTMLHEIKHAIDSNSELAVEGAAWEGAATTVEQQVWPHFIRELMADHAETLPLAILITEIDNVRFTATTDATLQRLLRESCDEGEPDTVDFVKRIVASYGFTDPDVLALRSQRAHDNTQYLEYEYGSVSYLDTMSFLEHAVGNGAKVDAFLLQACGMPSARKSQAHVEKLAACLKNRRHQ